MFLALPKPKVINKKCSEDLGQCVNTKLCQKIQPRSDSKAACHHQDKGQPHPGTKQDIDQLVFYLKPTFTKDICFTNHLARTF